jgi:hypothetical protein
LGPGIQAVLAAPVDCQITLETYAAVDNDCDGAADGPFITADQEVIFDDYLIQDEAECAVYQVCTANEGVEDVTGVQVTTDATLGNIVVDLGTVASSTTECRLIPAQAVSAGVRTAGSGSCLCSEVEGRTGASITAGTCALSVTDACDIGTNPGSVCEDFADVYCETCSVRTHNIEAALDEDCDGIADGAFSKIPGTGPFDGERTLTETDCVVFQICVSNDGQQDLTNVAFSDTITGASAVSTDDIASGGGDSCRLIPTNTPTSVCSDGPECTANGAGSGIPPRLGCCRVPDVLGVNEVSIVSATCEISATDACEKAGPICTDDVTITYACGTGVIEDDEQCDDGLLQNGTAQTCCSPECRLSGCHYAEYAVKESDKKATDGALPKGCTVTLDEVLFDFADGQDTAENYVISGAKSLGLPPQQGAGVATHLLGLQAKPAKQGALPVVDGKFPKARKRLKRQGVEVTISNPAFYDGSAANIVRIDTGKVTRLLVPTNKDHASVPTVPVDDTDHYLCHKAKVSKVGPFGSLQDEDGKVLKNLQVVFENQFADGDAHPTYGDARLLELKKVTEICNPVAKTNIDSVEQDAKGNTRETGCAVATAAVAAPNTSLLCWQAKVAAKAVEQPWDGASKGTAVRPKQGKHVKLTLKEGSPLYLGHQFTAPDRLDTSKELNFCFPATVTNPGAVN